MNIYRTIYTILYKIYRTLRNIKDDSKLKLLLRTGKLSKVRFVEYENSGKEVLVVKPRTIETIEMPQIFNFIDKGSFDVDYPKISIWKFENARVFHRSDFIQISKDEVIWPKRNNYNFSKNVIMDSFMYKYDYNIGYIKRPLKIIKADVAYSLIGVHSHIWSHSVWEYIPKLFQIRKLIDSINEKLTILVPDYQEPHLKKIVYEELKKYDVEVLVVREDEAVDVKTLYFMERAAKSTDHENYVEIGDFVQPQMTSDIWKQHISIPYIDMYVKDKEKEPSLKLYLPRRNGGYRMMTNNDEIEAYYKEKGFVFVEPHKISFQEVVNLFYHAKIIAGPFSSAFTNLMFCRPGVKAFIMCNYTRAFENFLEPFQQYFGATIKWQLGIDVDKDHPSHSSYYIPYELMKAACQKYGIE